MLFRVCLHAVCLCLALSASVRSTDESINDSLIEYLDMLRHEHLQQDDAKIDAKIIPMKYSSSPSHESGGSKFSLFNIFKKGGNDEGDMMGTCNVDGAVHINDHCYAYVGASMTHNEAKAFCARGGGQLWVPNTADVLLYKKIAAFMPEALGAVNEELWINAVLSGAMVVSGNAEDITHDYLIQINEGADIVTLVDGCVYFKFTEGAFYTSVDPEVNGVCEGAKHFICEYKILSDYW